VTVNPGGLIEVAVGAYLTLVAFGQIQASRNPQKNKEWLTQYGGVLKVAGPLLLLYGVASTVGLLP